ncbi:MAG: ABC transporter permease [Lachnospiraceae bacterium]|nr:ABC transporter permease [Lachnospiraceae bacterium]
MAKYILKRILWMIPVIIGVSLLVFVLLDLSPGEPARMVLGDQATNEDVEAFNEKYGLNEPLLVQYGKYIYRIITRLDFGESYVNGRSVTTEILNRFPKTFILALAITIIATMIGIILGMVAGLHRGSPADSIAQIFAVIGVSIPEFWLGLLLILLFGVTLRWFPVSGFYGPKYLVLPALTVGLICSASTMRITRSAVLDYINEDFIRTVRAKGQRETVITWKHIFKNALIPIVTNIGSQFASVLGGTITTETVFAIPGLGKMLREALTSRDYPQIRGTVIMLAVLVCVINLAVDLIYTYIDPRIRAEFTGNSKSGKKKLKGENAS